MTIQQALAWAQGGWEGSPYARNEQTGFGIDVDGNYGFQCVDFVTAYSIFLGTPVNGGAVENAITLWNPQPGWTKVSSPQPGDVFVRDAVFEGVNYGDTGIVVSVTDTGVNVIQQNLKADLYHGSPPGQMFWKFGALKGFMRSNIITTGVTMTEDGVRYGYEAVTGKTTKDDGAGYTEADVTYWVGRDPTEFMKNLYGFSDYFIVTANKKIADLESEITQLKASAAATLPQITDVTPAPTTPDVTPPTKPLPQITNNVPPVSAVPTPGQNLWQKVWAFIWG